MLETSAGCETESLWGKSFYFDEWSGEEPNENEQGLEEDRVKLDTKGH